MISLKPRKPRSANLTGVERATIIARMRHGQTSCQAVDGLRVDHGAAFRLMRDGGYRLRYITTAEAHKLGLP